jgi:hypothetical protein
METIFEKCSSAIPNERGITVVRVPDLARLEQTGRSRLARSESRTSVRSSPGPIVDSFFVVFAGARITFLFGAPPLRDRCRDVDITTISDDRVLVHDGNGIMAAIALPVLTLVSGQFESSVSAWTSWAWPPSSSTPRQSHALHERARPNRPSRQSLRSNLSSPDRRSD